MVRPGMLSAALLRKAISARRWRMEDLLLYLMVLIAVAAFRMGLERYLSA